jgi:Ca2+/Na+ antiporter
MFTTGQKIFALIFIISFAVFISIQYYKDKKRNEEMFKGSFWVLLAIILVFILFIIIQKFKS